MNLFNEYSPYRIDTGGVNREISSDHKDELSPVDQSTLTTDCIESYLDSLVPLTQTNVDYLLTLRAVPRIALACSTNNGNKFWVGVATEKGISVRWGKLGSRGRTKHIPITYCRRNNPPFELKVRFLEKLRKGYLLMPYETNLP